MRLFRQKHPGAFYKKPFLLFSLAALSSVTLLTGCHGAKDQSAFTIPGEFDTSRDYEITFWAKNDTNKTQTEIYKKAISDFEALYPNITVDLRLYTDYGKIYNDVITNIATGTTPDVCITYPDHIATYLTGNDTVVPLDDLMAAGKTFQEKLGDDYYPLHLGAYDRMILMVFYLESKYGKDWADPTTSTLNYDADQIAEGIDFIKSLVEGHVIMSLPTYYGSNGDNAAHQSTEWITGKLAGCFEWDSSATKYQDALDEENKPGFTVGEEIKFGDYNGGFSKVSMGLAITKTSKCVAEAATLINFLLNEEKGASIMGSECGIPASKAGLGYAQAAGAVKDLVADANAKVMAFTTNKLDPLFENNDLKASGTGIYQEVFDTVDYDGVSGADVVDTLLDGMESVGYTIG